MRVYGAIGYLSLSFMTLSALDDYGLALHQHLRLSTSSATVYYQIV